VYFADLVDGVFAFPDTGGAIPIANRQPAALYMVSTQGAQSLTLDSQDNLYLAVYSSAITPSGGDTLAQITIDNVTVPASPIGTPVSPSVKLNPVTTILNDTACTGSPAPSVTFAANASTTATATVGTVGACSATFTGSSSLATTVTFTPITAGTDSISLTGTDQAGNTGDLTITRPVSGFSLSPSLPAVSVIQGSNNTDTITINDAGGFSGAVALTASGLPSGVTASFATNPATNSSLLTLTASSTATAGGPVTVTITGTSGTLTASTTIALTVNPPPSFALSGTSITVVSGATTGNTSTITVAPSNGFTGMINLSCSIQPTPVTEQVTCSLSPTSLTFAGTTPQTSTLTVITAGKISQNQMRRLLWPAAGGTALALLLLFGVPRRRRNWPAIMGLLVLFVSIGAIGCIGGGGGSPSTAPQYYTITVTGASGTLTETGQVSLTIQ
jgi:hypothetical protein